MSTISGNEEDPLNIASTADTKQIVSKYRETIKKASLEEVELDGKKKFYKLRTKWSWAIIAWISVILIFNVMLSRNTGMGYWNFEKYPYLLHEILGMNLAQIIGMGFVVVKFLFPTFEKNSSTENDSYDRIGA